MEQLVVQVIHSFNATSANQISIRKGDLLTVLDRDNSGWWIGRTASGATGIFPSTYVQRVSNDPVPEEAAADVARARVLNGLGLKILSNPDPNALPPVKDVDYDDLFALDDAELDEEAKELRAAMAEMRESARGELKALVDEECADNDDRSTLISQQLKVSSRALDDIQEQLELAQEEYDAALATLTGAGIAVPACLTAAPVALMPAPEVDVGHTSPPQPKLDAPRASTSPPQQAAAADDDPDLQKFLDKAEGDLPSALALREQEDYWKAINAVLDGLEVKRADAERTIGQLEARIAQASADDEAAQASAADSNGGGDGGAAAKQREAEAAHAACEAERQRLAELEAELAERTAELTASQDEYARQAAKLTAMQEQCEASTATMSDTTARVAALEQELEQLRNESYEAEERVKRYLASVQAERDAAVKAYKDVEKQRRVVYNELQELRGNLRVYCRLRPRGKGDTAFVTPDDDITLRVTDPDSEQTTTYEFDMVLGEQATQQEVFQEVQPLAVSILDGYNVCVFAYGQTGSGKTHTMEGHAKDRGLSFRTMSELFDMAAARAADDYETTFQLSVLEVYNNKVFDLLSERAACTVRWGGPSQGVVVQPLSTRAVASVAEVERQLKDAYAHRSVAGTDCNMHSSRSHCLLTIYVTCLNPANRSKTTGKLHLIDLAGSERVKNSGVEGDRLKEATHINTSLTHLKSVIQSLATGGDQHVPFRNSALTSLLQDSLGGNCKCLMFANVSVLGNNVPETICTLKYASEARKVMVGKATASVRRV